MLLTCDVDVDVREVISHASTADLMDELRSRDSDLPDLDYDRLYQILVRKDTQALVQEITQIVQQNTGRIVP